MAMVLLMMVSALAGIATGEVVDGTSTTGVDRNPTEQEQDGASINRVKDTTVQSNIVDSVIFTGDHTMAMGTATTQNTNTDMADNFVRGCSIDVSENMAAQLTSGTGTFTATDDDDLVTTTNGYGSGLLVDITTSTTAITQLIASDAGGAAQGTGYAVGDEVRVTKATLVAAGNTAASEDIVWLINADDCETGATAVWTAHNAKNRHGEVTAGAVADSNIDIDIAGNGKTTVGYHGDTYSGTDNSMDPAVAAQSGFILGEVEFFDDAQRTTKLSTDNVPIYGGDCFGAAVTTCDNIMQGSSDLGDPTGGDDDNLQLVTRTNVHAGDMNTLGMYYELGTSLDDETTGELTTSTTTTVNSCTNGNYNVALTTATGTGTGAWVTITCASNAITVVSVMAVDADGDGTADPMGGMGYKQGDILTVTEQALDDTGTAFGCSAAAYGSLATPVWDCLKVVVKAGDLTDNMRDDAIGFDLTFAHNYSVLINGAAQTVGDAKGIGQMDTIVFRADNTTLALPDISMTMPTAYSFTNQSDILNSSTRLNVVSKTVVHFTTTLDIAGDKDCTLTSDDSTDASCNGIIWDPSFTFGADTEPGIRVGNIENGAGSWCDAKWWFASCGSSISVDGNATSGMDGAMIKYQIPASVMYSQASWGGWEKIELNLKHSTTQCFNGVVNAYMVAPSDIGNFRTQKSLVSYLLYGDYYNYTTPTGGYSIGSQVYGSSSADYCFTASDSTTIHLTGLDEYTGSYGMYQAYEEGFYDFNTRMFTFYLLLDVDQTRVVDTAGTDEFEFETDYGASSQNFALGFTYEAARNALLGNDASSVTRTTNNTNDTSPNFASPYTQYHHLTAPTALMAGNNGSDAGSVSAGVIYDTAALTDEVYSTFECGVNAHGASVKQITITMYVDTNFTGANASWQPYGTINSNGTQWAWGPTTGASAVDNTEQTTTSEAASFTGVFTNGENYKANCEIVYWSYDAYRNRMSTITMAYDTIYTPQYDAQAPTGGGAIVDDDDDWEWNWLWDTLIVVAGFGLLGLGLYMWSMGNTSLTLRDERLSMILGGLGIILAWASHQYGPGTGTGYWDADEVEILASIGYALLVVGAWNWAQAGNKSEMNQRNLLSGLVLVIAGSPSALEAYGGEDIAEAAADAMWLYPVNSILGALGAAVGILLIGMALLAMWQNRGD